ncbi:Chromosomal replication initiator protein DnaA [Streptococcus sp. HSISB1]|nr:Chromosomal replication initiator protein DnaA [Streptococcus sp. HSISB1]
MTENEQIFWNRVLELAKSQLKQATYEFFVLDARLIQIEQNIATIYLDPMKELFWDKNLKPIILTAGFEVYNAEIVVNYVFEEDLAKQAIAEPTSQVLQAPQKSNLPQVDSDLNTKYTFDNFVQGDENRWAFSASYAVADAPGTTYNPLFIWGGPGLGKTHLLNAIGNAVLQNNPKARVKYITAENFINEFVIHIRLDTMEELKEKFRNLDVLLIDDIQSLAKKHYLVRKKNFSIPSMRFTITTSKLCSPATAHQIIWTIWNNVWSRASNGD